jgi:hypothetical protein
MGLMQMLFWRKNFKDGNCPYWGSLQPCTVLFEFPEVALISCVKPIEKYLVFEPWTGTKSQIYSQSKLTTLICENLKIRHENGI